MTDSTTRGLMSCSAKALRFALSDKGLPTSGNKARLAARAANAGMTYGEVQRFWQSPSRSPLRERREEPRRREAPQEDASWWEWASVMLVSRCGGLCERCDQPLTRDNFERHHRMRRRDGGDRLANLLALHTECHRYITEHPEESRANGWIVPVTADDPATVAVMIRGTWWTLDDYGLKHVVP